MSAKLLTEHHLEFLSLKGSSESTLVKIPHCWKSHVAAHMFYTLLSGWTYQSCNPNKYLKADHHRPASETPFKCKDVYWLGLALATRNPVFWGLRLDKALTKSFTRVMKLFMKPVYILESELQRRHHTVQMCRLVCAFVIRMPVSSDVTKIT